MNQTSKISGSSSVTHGSESRPTNLVITKRLLDLLSGCEKAEVEECGDAYTRDRRPSKLVDKLEGQKEEVCPDASSR